MLTDPAVYGSRVNNPGAAVRNTSLSCLRVSSIYVIDPGNSDTFVEVGWYDNCGDDAQCSSACSQVTSPHVLVSREINGTATCKQSTPAVAVTSPPADGDKFSLKNPDHDNDWDFYWNFDFEGNYFVGFAIGSTAAGVGERHYGADSAYGHHDGLDYFTGQNTWREWTNTNALSDVSDYAACVYSNTDVASKQVC